MTYFYETYSTTPSANNAAPPDGAPEGMAPSTVNNTMRQEMSAIAELGERILAAGTGAGPPDDGPTVLADAFAAAVYDVCNPVGKIVTWSGGTTPNTTAPTGVVWHLCDGANGTPDLRNRLIQGVNVLSAGSDTPDNAGQDVTVTDATNPLWTSALASGASDTTGDHTHSVTGLTVDPAVTGATVAGHQLTLSEIPSHTHTYTRDGAGATNRGQDAVTAAAAGSSGTSTGSAGGNGTHSHSLTDPGHTHATSGGTIGNAGDHSHTVTGTISPQRQALQFWMRTV